MASSARPLDNAITRWLPTMKSRVSSASHQPDYWLLTIILVMVMFGTVMIFSSSFAIGVQSAGGDGYYFLTRHLMYLMVGLVGMMIAMSIDYHFWRRFSLAGMGIVIILMGVMMFIPGLAPETWGASRWIALGPFSFQPSELAKLALVLYLADWLASKGRRVRDWNYGLVPFGLILGVLVGMVMLQPDLGTSTVLTLTGVSMFLVAGANILHLFFVGVVGMVGFLILALSAEYRRDRIFIFLNPEADPMNLGWQLTQAKIAIGSGGLLGVGLGASKQKFSWLPAAHNDAIFAVIAEELGLLGGGFVLMLFMALAWRGYRVAMRAPDTFGTLMAVGIVTWIISQSVLNIGGVTTTIPFTGIPIPFISYGGSSLVVSLFAMGILLNISRQTVDQSKLPLEESPDEDTGVALSRSSQTKRRAPTTQRADPVGRKARVNSSDETTQSSVPPVEGPSTTTPTLPSRRNRLRAADGRAGSQGGSFGRGSLDISSRGKRKRQR